MNVLTLLSPALRTRATEALRRGHHVLAVESVAEADRALHRAVPDVILVDPLAAGPAAVAGAASRWQAVYGVPIIIYTGVLPETTRCVLDLGHLMARDLVLAGYDDSPSRLREAVEAQPSIAFSQQFVARLRGAIDQLPQPLAHAVGRLFRAPRDIASSAHLASRVGMKSRSIERWTHRVGLTAPAALIAGARGIRACFLLRATTASTGEIADRAGFGSGRRFNDRLHAATGLTPRMVRALRTPELFDRVESHLRRR